MAILRTITQVIINGEITQSTNTDFDTVECSGELGMEVNIIFDSETDTVTGVGGRTRNRKNYYYGFP